MALKMKMYKMYVLRFVFEAILFDLCVSFAYLVGSLHSCLVLWLHNHGFMT